MSDPLVEIATKSYELVIAGVVGVMAWVAKRTIKRVDDVEQNIKQTREDYVKKIDFNETVNSLRTEIRQGHQQISTQIENANRQHQSRLDDLFSILIVKADERIAKDTWKKDE